MEDQIMSIVRWNQPAFANLLDDFFARNSSNLVSVFEPAVNVLDNKDSFEIQVAIPGYSKDDVKIAVENNTLTVSAELETKEDDTKFNRREFAKTSFERSFTLPRSIDQEKVGAKFENGILTITLPRKAELMLKKEIAIS